MQQIKIEQAKPEDLEEIKKLFVRTIESSCKNDYSDGQISVWTMSRHNDKRWQKAIKEQLFLIAKIESKIIAFASLKNFNEIDFLYVHPRQQNQGIATRLVNSLEKTAKSQKSKDLTTFASKTALSFFQKQDFKILKENIVTKKGTKLKNYKMRKTLTNQKKNGYPKPDKLN